MTADERVATATVVGSLKFENGLYEVGIPWKDGETKLTNNYEAALLRLQSQEKSLRKKDPSILEAYSKVFKDYEKKGYIQKVPKSEVDE